ncbi:hypothetical protein [Mucilaginibacter phyllosphaerae]|uniref:Uncharacterized protein n=1 Tax=Mucilaginibacter phyllosphaerae TaxID=1812349 RepID=A0A4Y8ABQ8_9SPHI|nr:hypothetical protein [Mucilaginibacter phyllosphaerae]MBB3969915.1 hypothetical protein [Mucilaginibacter phyllosphaerae]TEW65289.1 hypothetical protein E2R65_15365 [Mucilaginibacter phyllosphaerae]GGH16828.1 hypothetical protein GCM10007352_26480 [Mucilaginibacter phyllosphaerae]
MNLDEIISDFDFDSVVRHESREYLNEGYKIVSYSDKDDDKKFITNGLKRFSNKDDKIVFLIEAINHQNELLDYVSTRIDYKVIDNYDNDNFSINNYEEFQRNQELLKEKKNHEARIFYAVRELEKLGLNDLNKNAFSQPQVSDLTRKINALLIKIDELSVGQEVIFNFIDELKGDLKDLNKDYPLGKKRWYQRFSGIVASYLGNKSADALYDLIKPDIIKILQDVSIDKLLH